MKPEYADPDSVPPYVKAANQLIMGTCGTPLVPLLIAQGAGGELEGTSGGQAGIGPGDGVMIAGDVPRSPASTANAAWRSSTTNTTPSHTWKPPCRGWQVRCRGWKHASPGRARRRTARKSTPATS